VRVDAADESIDAGPRELFHFEPGERHSVTSDSGGSVLLFLAPWPTLSASEAASEAARPSCAASDDRRSGRRST
jgi:hypothetical protein